MSLVSIKRFDSVSEAELAKNLLEQQGIRSMIQKDGIPGSTGLIQSAELFVEEKDRDAAKQELGIA